MAKLGEIKKMPFLNEEQQKCYEKLAPRQRLYVDYRVGYGQMEGLGKRDAYVRAGYKAGKTAPQGAYVLEATNKGIADIIETITKAKRAMGIYNPNSEIAKQIDAAVVGENANSILQTVQNANPDVAEQIQFYRDIVAGKIKSKRRTKYIDKGGIASYKVEEIDDVKERILARKELDRILGINKFIDIGSVEVGDITINIVDTSKNDRSDDEKPLASIYKNTNEEIIVETAEVKGQKTENDIEERDSPHEEFFTRKGIKYE